eukprot:447603_1
MITIFSSNAWRCGLKVSCYFLSLISGSIIARYLMIRARRKILGIPPGIIGLPIFGCLFSLAFYPKHLLEYIGNKYGKICTIRLGTKDIIIVNDIALYQQVNEIAELNLHRPPVSYSIW